MTTTPQRRVVIAGGAGFIGSHLCDRFVQEGYAVACIDNLLTGRRENIAHLLTHRTFTFLERDVTEPLTVEGPVTAVFHLASPASPQDYLRFPIHTLRVGALGTLHLLELARAKGAALILASSSEVYGDAQEHPQPETYWGHVNPVGPRSVYDEAKRFAETLTMAYQRRYGLPVRIARIFNTYGPRMRPYDGRAIPTFIAQALEGRPLTVYGDGSQTRAFCYISDLVEGIFRLFNHALTYGRTDEDSTIVNLGHPEEMTVAEAAQAVAAAIGSRLVVEFRPLPTDDPKVRRPNIARARRLLGWEPVVPFADGLRETIRYFADQRPPSAAGR